MISHRDACRSYVRAYRRWWRESMAFHFVGSSEAANVTELRREVRRRWDRVVATRRHVPPVVEQ